MIQASIYQPRTASPTALTMVVLLHGAALAALVLARMEMPEKPGFTKTVVEMIKIKKPPPEVLPPEPAHVIQPPQINYVEPIVKTQPPPEDFTWQTQPKQTWVDPGPPARPAERVIEPPPVPEPVRRAASIDPRSDLKPDYPLSERRAGTEGTVTVKVLIGPDGRVRNAEKVRATNDAFLQATLRHVLRNWRFKPATVDGRPVESSKVMTVHFALESEDG